MVIGHQKQWQFLRKSLELGKRAHAYLFSGETQLGKKKFALEFAKLINGENFDFGHPDLILIEPYEGREIQIIQIRELIQKLSLKPYSAFLKVAMIDQAHLMNSEAQNCFLKTLEEPKGNTILILITEAPETLFPTIRSRCEIIKFYPVKISEIENYLESQGISKEKSKAIARLSLGRPGLAIDFLTNPQKLENQKKIIEELIKISSGKTSLSLRFQYAKDLVMNPELSEILNIWLSYFRTLLLEQFLPPEVKKPEYPFSKLKNIIKQI
ncbi:MAG: hypothetical protein COW72_02905, partial [Candidatus Nealsonbacteria bacterium CG18_big_fil_WC_8_21_14_2_50_37_10]